MSCVLDDFFVLLVLFKNYSFLHISDGGDGRSGGNKIK